MKIKKLIAMKEECENKIKCLKLAMAYAETWNAETWNIDHGQTTKITLTPEQAKDVCKLLDDYKKLLNMVIDSAEVDIG